MKGLSDRRQSSSPSLSMTLWSGGRASIEIAESRRSRVRRSVLAWLVAVVSAGQVAADSRTGQVQPASSLFQSDLFFLATALEDELRLNRRALEVAGPSRQALLWLDRAVLHARAGDMAHARQALTAARTVAGLVGPLSEAQVLLKSGTRLLSIELLEDAASYLEEAARLLNQQNDGVKREEILAFIYSRLFHIYGRLGLDDLKRSAKERLESSVSQDGNRDVLGFVEFIDAGESFLESEAKERELPQAMAAIRRLIDLYKGSANAANRRLGQLLENLLQLLEAIDNEMDLKKVVMRQTDDPQMLFVLKFIAPMFEAMKRGEPDEAFSAFDQITELLPPDAFSSQLLQAKILMTRALWETLVLDRPSEDTVASCKEAIARFESYLENMRVDEARTGLIDDEGFQFYRFGVEILARVSPEDSFDYAERGRAWTLRHLLGSPRETLSQKQAPEAERLRDKITASGPGLAPVDPVTLGQLQREILPRDTTLIAYFPGFRAPGVPQLRIWAVDRNGMETASTLMSTEGWQDIACLIQALRWQKGPSRARQAAKDRGALILSDCHDLLDDPAGALYRRLFAPIAPHLRHRRLIIVPHRLLHRVPFAALRNPETGRYLVEEHTLSVAPSLSTLAIVSERTSRSRSDVLVMGDPKNPRVSSLAGARQEARTVAGLLAGEALLGNGTLLGDGALLGSAASESAVRTNVDRIRLLHLAAHGQYDRSSPRNSRIYLSADDEHDGTLEAREIWDQLDFGGTELVVLSGCETGLADVTRGDDALGLTYAFLVAGSRTVISTLWPVDDIASSELMTAFYRGYLEEGKPAAEALRAAQLEILERDATAPPYYWAGFTLTGDPESRWRR